MTDQEDTKPRVQPATVWTLIIIIVVGMVVGWNILVNMFKPISFDQRIAAFTTAVEEAKAEGQLKVYLKDGKLDPTLDEIIQKHLSADELAQNRSVLEDWLNRRRLPYLSRLEKNMSFTERSGKQVELKDLKGKIIVACWVFTRCPRGCTGVAGEMRKLHEELQGNPKVHFLSVSVDPADTPEDLKKFADALGIKGDNWWFVNGPKDAVRVYMTRYFGFLDVRDLPESERMSPDDKFEHDMRVALVDPAGHVRGLYGIANPDPQYATMFREKIRTDIKTLLEGESE
jgi:protein SCO1/2